MRYVNLLIILLLLLLPFTVSAGTGEKNVKVVDKDGKDVTDDNRKEGSSSKVSSSSHEDSSVPVPTTAPSITNVEAGTQE